MNSSRWSDYFTAPCQLMLLIGLCVVYALGLCYPREAELWMLWDWTYVSRTRSSLRYHLQRAAAASIMQTLLGSHRLRDARISPWLCICEQYKGHCCAATDKHMMVVYCIAERSESELSPTIRLCSCRWVLIDSIMHRYRGRYHLDAFLPAHGPMLHAY